MRGDQRCECACHWNWGWLTGAFGDTLISVTDADCMFLVERKGAIILIETKHIGEKVKRGQRETLETFSNKSRCLSVVCWGPRSSPEFFSVCLDGVWNPPLDKPGTTNRDDFRCRMARWFERANGGQWPLEPPPKLDMAA